MKAFLKRNLFTIIGIVISVGMMAYFCISTGLENFYETFARLNPTWLLAAVGCMLLYWLCEALGLHVLIHHLYPTRRFSRTLRVAMIGQLYNAVTPFASGGQPMQLYEMTVNDGISAGNAGSILTRRTIVFQFCSTVAFTAALVYAYGFFRENVSEFVIITLAAMAINVLYLGALILLSRSPRLTRSIGGGCIRLLHRIHLLKNPERATATMERQLELFHSSARTFSSADRDQALSCAVTLVQLAGYYLIPYCLYRGFGFTSTPVFLMMAAAAYVYSISSFIPLPGGSGAAEGSFYMLFLMFFSAASIAPAMLLWRTITYYSCFLVGIICMMLGKGNKNLPTSKELPEPQ